MKERLALALKCLLMLALACAVGAGVLGFSGCGSRGQLEQMPAEDFEVLQSRCDILTRVVAARALADGKVRPETFEAVADALQIVAADPLALAGPNVITRALEDAGFTDQEAMLALLLVEDFLRARFNWGATTSPLGPNARALVLTVSNAIRVAINGDVTADEFAAGSAMLESASDAR